MFMNATHAPLDYATLRAAVIATQTNRRPLTFEEERELREAND